MSKKSAIWVITWPLSATLAWCKKTIDQCFRTAAQTDFSPACFTDGPSDLAQAASVIYPIKIDFGQDRIELNELIAVMRVGDRIRLFCDDGILVAEKVSQTQLKVVHSQTMATFIH